jgi:hypothetical protein
MKRRGATKSRINYDKPNDDKVIVSSEYYEDERPSFICSICNRTLSRLTDSGGQNSNYWCRSCSVEFDPELENVRRESKLSVPDRNIEPTVATTPGIPDISIRKEPEIKGGLKALQQKGLKITNYKEDIQKPEKMTLTRCPKCKRQSLSEVNESEVFGVSRNRMHVYNRIEKGTKCLLCGYKNCNFGIK